MTASANGEEVESTNHKNGKTPPVMYLQAEQDDYSTQKIESQNCCNRLFSPNIKNLIYQIFQLSWAVILGNLFTFLVNTQCLIFCGQLGATELAAGSLSNTIIMVFGNSIAIGMTTAVDTLCAQAYGAKNYTLVGIVLQRGVFILAITAILVCSLWMLTQHFLLFIGFESHIAEMSDTFMIIMLPMVPAEFLAQLLIKYLQTQGIVRPLVIIGAVTNICALGLFLLIVTYLKQGFRGIAIALMLVSYIRMALLLLFIKIRKLHEKTWRGWSTECLYGWKQYLSLSFPGLLMICMEWWTFEIGSFILGSFGETVVATYGIMMQLTMVSFMVPYGVSISASILVGNFLGANNPEQAVLATKLSMAMGLICSSIVVIVSLTCRKYIVMIFSDDEKVINLFVYAIPMVVFFFIQDCVQGICSGAIRGCGRQKIGMIINFVSHDLVAVPLCVVFAIVLNQGLLGVWWGIGIGVFIQSFTYVVFLSCTNWKRQSELAVRRTSKRWKKNPLEKTRDSNVDDQLLDSKPEKGCEDNEQVEVKHGNGGAKGLLQQEPEADDPALVVEDFDRQMPDRKITGKLVLIRVVPFLLSFLVLGAALSVRFFVPLPVANTLSMAKNESTPVNGTSF